MSSSKDASQPIGAGTEPKDQRRLSSYSWQQLDMQCSVISTADADIDLAAALIKGQLDLVDHTSSRFRTDSELANVPRGRWTEISPLLSAFITAALDAAELTDGAVDPTVDVGALGYDDDLELVRDRSTSPAPTSEPGSVAPAPGPGRIGFDREGNRLLLPIGVSLDLGSSARAWAADWAATTCAQVFGGGFLVDLGGDLAAAGTAPNDGWQVTIEDPADAGVRMLRPRISLHSGGLTTFSVTAPTGHPGTTVPQQIVHPATGEPASSIWRSVTVSAKSAELAHTASAAAVVMGLRGPDWLSRRDIAGRLVPHLGPVRYTGAWHSDRPVVHA